MTYKFLNAGVNCKSEKDSDYRAFVYYVDAGLYPHHYQEEIEELRGYEKTAVGALADAWARYEDLK